MLPDPNAQNYSHIAVVHQKDQFLARFEQQWIQSVCARTTLASIRGNTRLESDGLHWADPRAIQSSAAQADVVSRRWIATGMIPSSAVQQAHVRLELCRFAVL